MKKALLLPMFAALLMAGAAQAVTVHWAVTTLPALTQGDTIPNSASGYEITSAVLVYVTSGIPVYLDDTFTVGTQIGDDVTGLAITPSGIGQQDSFDSVERTEGNYYVVLFATDTGGSGQTYYTTSTTGLVWNDTDAITTDEMAPATGLYDPGSFANWQPIPEPGTASLLFAGIAVALLRRRRA